MQEIEKMTDEEVSAVYEDLIKQDSYEKHSGLYWCSSSTDRNAGIQLPCHCEA